MKLILFKNKKKCDSVDVATMEHLLEVIGQNQPCPKGAAKMPACFVKALDLRMAKLFALCLAGKHFGSQQNIKISISEV